MVLTYEDDDLFRSFYAVLLWCKEVIDERIDRPPFNKVFAIGFYLMF